MGREISMSVERAAMNAIQIEASGNAAEVVKAVDIPDVGAPSASEMVIAVEASPVNISARPRGSGRLSSAREEQAK